jgi:hypothetical protein
MTSQNVLRWVPVSHKTLKWNYKNFYEFQPNEFFLSCFSQSYLGNSYVEVTSLQKLLAEIKIPVISKFCE